jgi:hypothetical protein
VSSASRTFNAVEQTVSLGHASQGKRVPMREVYHLEAVPETGVPAALVSTLVFVR